MSWSSKSGHFFKRLSVKSVLPQIQLGLNTPNMNDVFGYCKTSQYTRWHFPLKQDTQKERSSYPPVLTLL